MGGESVGGYRLGLGETPLLIAGLCEEMGR